MNLSYMGQMHTKAYFPLVSIVTFNFFGWCHTFRTAYDMKFKLNHKSNTLWDENFKVQMLHDICLKVFSSMFHSVLSPHEQNKS